MKRRILSMLCVLALMLSMLAMPAYATDQAPGTVAAVCGEKNYSSLQAAMDDYSFGTIVLQNDAQDVTVPLNVHLDTNGHNVAGVTVADGATLYVSDSQTDDYTVADGIYGKITDATGAVQADEGYVAVTEEGAVSYHKADLTLTSMTLRPAVAGVYYNSAFAADEVLAANVECYGVALSVVAEPTAENLDTLCGYSTIYGFANGEKSGTLLSGIMTDGNTDFANDRNAAMDIYGRAYIKTADGYTFGATASRSLKEQVQAIDAVFATLNAAQKTSILEMYKDHESVMSAWELANITEASDSVLAGDVEITVPVETQDGEVIETVTVEQDGVTVTIPFGTLVDTNELTLTVTKETETDVEAAEGQSLLPLDVHVEGLSAANTVPLTIELGKVMPENLNMGNYAAYHTEDNGANEMTLVANDEEFTAHNQYKYTLDGEVTLHVASFSLFTLRSTDSNAWAGERTYDWYDPNATELYIRNADQLAGFGAIVGNMASVDGEDIAQDSFKGKTVKLLADIYIGDLDSENAYVFYPIGYWNNRGSYEKCYGEADVSSGFYAFQGIFDGNGNTISDFYQNTWEMVGDYNDGYSGTPNYYRDGMGLFGKVYGGTVKNLTVRNFSCDSEHGTSGTIAAYADCGATFENISIFGCNPRVYNIGNGGIVGCSGWYAQEAAADKVTFKNITVDQTNKISALWDATGTSAGGILGQYYPTSGQSSAGYPENPGILFENCHTAAIIEVNNDCCSNYHYYWYRYSGMLMGSIRKNTTEGGYTVADTTGITAEGCTYTYGNWNEYWYCELVKNTIASYTHDHQFSRLTSITDLSEITDDGGKTWLKEGNFALLDENRNCVDCFHIFKDSNGTLYRHLHDQADESNGYEPYENFDVNNDGVTDAYDLKEDRQRYYIPFSQLFTGDGMGVKAHHEFSGVTVSKDGVALADEKFQVKEGADLVFDPGQIVNLSDIVELTDFGKSKLTSAALNATASPVTEEDTVNVTYHQDVKDWTNNTITFSEDSFGLVKLVLTDYFYCKPTVIYVTVGEDAVPAVKFDDILDKTLAQQEEELVIAENTVLSAGQIFQATANNVEGEKVKITVAPADESSTVEPVTYTSTAADWTTGTLQFKGRGKATVTVTEGRFCIPTEVTVTVDSVKAASDAMDFSAGGTVNGICPACASAGDKAATVVKWLALGTRSEIGSVTKRTEQDENGTAVQTTHPDHYYLSASKNYKANSTHYAIETEVCLNLNGQELVSKQRAFYNETAETTFNIMGDGYVKGAGLTSSNIVNRGVLDFAGIANLYGGTYESTHKYGATLAARGNADDRVVSIYEGTVIQRSEETPGLNIFITDKSTVNIYGGTVIGGDTSAVDADENETPMPVSGGNILLMSSRGASTYSCKLNIYGGTITGGKDVKGGNIFIQGNAGPANVTITGGTIVDGDIYVSETKAGKVSLSLSGKPTISCIEFANNTLAGINGLSLDVAPIKVVGGDQVKFTKAITENAEAYEKVFYVDQDRKAVAAADNQLMIDDTCPHCDVALCKITWTEITAIKTIQATGHYRIANDIAPIEGAKAANIVTIGTSTKTNIDAVVDIYGHALTSEMRCFYVHPQNKVCVFDSQGGAHGTSKWAAGEGSFLYADKDAVANIYDVSMTGSTAGCACAISGAVGSTINIYSGIAEAITVTKTGAGYANVRNRGTLNIYGGTFQAVTDANGNKYAALAYGGTVNIYGGEFEGIVTAIPYYDKTSTVTTQGVLNISGGTIQSVSGTSASTLNISGKPVIAQVDLLADQKLNIGEMTDGASVTVNAANDTVVSNALTAENADTYGKYFHALDENLDVTVVTLESGDKVLQVTDDFCVHCGESIGDIQWIELNDTTVESLQLVCTDKTYNYLPTGHYKVTGNVSFEGQMMIGDYKNPSKITGDVVVDLNGHTVTLDKDVKSRVFFVTNPGSKLTIVDSRPNATHEDDTGILGGRIIGTSTVGGGSLYVSAETTIDMYGGTVLESEIAAPSQGGAVYCAGIFNLHSGKIIGTTVSQWGGTFYLIGGQLNVYSGTVEGGIAPGGTGNCIYTGGNAQLNVYGGTVNGEIAHASTSKAQITLSGAPTVTQLVVPAGKTITVNELTEGASIGVTATAGGVFTNAGAAQYEAYFHVYDDEAFTLAVEGDALALIESTVLYAGFNRTSVVPKNEDGSIAYSVRLGGGAAIRETTECAEGDDITVSCIAVKRGAQTYLIYTMDYLTAGNSYVVPAKAAISKATGIPQSNILMHTTHTHASVHVASTEWTNGPQYRNDFYNWVCEAGAAALNDLAPATAAYGSTTAYYGDSEENRMAWVRHYVQYPKDDPTDRSYYGSNFGTAVTGDAAANYTKEHLYDADNELQMIRLMREDQKDILMASFPAHATLNEKKVQMSADFPHFFRTYVEEQDQDLHCAYFIAAAGDQVPSSRLSGEQYTTVAKAYGEKLGEIAVAALDELTPATEGDILFKSKTLTLATNKPTSEEVADAEAVFQEWKRIAQEKDITITEARASDEGRAAATNAKFASIYQVSAIRRHNNLGATDTMDVKVMAIGDMSFVFAPYEMFGCDGMEIKDENAQNFGITFMITCGEGDEGYIPTQEGWDIKSYESHVTDFAQFQKNSEGEDINTNKFLNQEFLAMLAELKAQQAQ